MAGIGLASAVAGYQQGVQWRQQQDQIARMQQQQAAMDEANMAAGNLLKQDQQQHVMRGGDPATYKPPEGLLFKAAEARSSALAKSGLWDQFMQNEAKVAPMRLRSRMGAVQQYEGDRDPVKFIMAVNESMFNGKEIKGVTKVEGADAVQGLAARPGGVEVEFTDGTRQFVDPDAAAKGIKLGAMDPAAYLKQEAALAKARIEADIEAGKQERIAKSRGDQARETAGVRASGRLTELQTKLGGQQAMQTEKLGVDERIATDRSQAMRDVAGLNAVKPKGLAGAAPRDESGRTPGEQDRRVKDQIDVVQRRINSLSSQLNKATDSTSRKRITADIEAANTRLKSLEDGMLGADQPAPSGRTGGGLSDAPRAGMETARAEAISGGKPVDVNLGGLQGTIGADGGLYKSGEKAPAGPAKKSANDDKFVKGKVYKDAKGNRARYAGDGKWDPA